MTILLTVLLLGAIVWAVLERRARSKAEDRASIHLDYAVRVAEKLLTERQGGTERAKKVARDFCRYNPPDYVVACVLDDETVLSRSDSQPPGRLADGTTHT